MNDARIVSLNGILYRITEMRISWQAVVEGEKDEHIPLLPPRNMLGQFERQGSVFMHKDELTQEVVVQEIYPFQVPANAHAMDEDSGAGPDAHISRDAIDWFERETAQLGQLLAAGVLLQDEAAQRLSEGATLHAPA